MRDALINLQNFNTKVKMEECVIMFMLREFSTKEEKEQIRKPFF